MPVSDRFDNEAFPLMLFPFLASLASPLIPAPKAEIINLFFQALLSGWCRLTQKGRESSFSWASWHYLLQKWENRLFNYWFRIHVNLYFTKVPFDRSIGLYWTTVPRIPFLIFFQIGWTTRDKFLCCWRTEGKQPPFCGINTFFPVIQSIQVLLWRDSTDILKVPNAIILS